MKRVILLPAAAVCLLSVACDHRPPTGPDEPAEASVQAEFEAYQTQFRRFSRWEGMVVGGGFLVHRLNCASLRLFIAAKVWDNGRVAGRMWWTQHNGTGSFYDGPNDHDCVSADLRHRSRVEVTEMLVSLDGSRTEVCGVITRSTDSEMVGERISVAILDGGRGGLDKAILNPMLSDCDPDVYDPPAWATDTERFDVDGQGVFMGPVYGFDMQRGNWLVRRH